MECRTAELHQEQTQSVPCTLRETRETVGAMYLAGEDCVVQGILVILVGIKHGEKAAVQSRRSDVSQKTQSGGGGGELRL